jgi:hypothetical protein
MAEPSTSGILSAPELRWWLEDTHADSVWSYISHGGSFAHAAAVLMLCAPDTVEARGCLLLAERYEETAFERWWTHLEGDRVAIEQVVNHVHLWDVLPDIETVPEEAVENFGERLAEVWRALFAARYPDRPITVELDTSPDEYGPTLVVFQTP